MPSKTKKVKDTEITKYLYEARPVGSFYFEFHLRVNDMRKPFAAYIDKKGKIVRMMEYSAEGQQVIPDTYKTENPNSVIYNENALAQMGQMYA